MVHSIEPDANECKIITVSFLLRQAAELLNSELQLRTERRREKIGGLFWMCIFVFIAIDRLQSSEFIAILAACVPIPISL